MRPTHTLTQMSKNLTLCCCYSQEAWCSVGSDNHKPLGAERVNVTKSLLSYKVNYIYSFTNALTILGGTAPSGCDNAKEMNDSLS